MASADPSVNDKERFACQLRKALAALYDPHALRNSPLARLLDLDARRDVASALRRVLTEAIEALRPGDSVPQGSRTWRVYQILRRRYTEQLTQHEVASDLGLSVRHLQREEKVAREVLANHLWARHKLEQKLALATAPPEACEDEDASPPSRDQELARLSESLSPQMVALDAVLDEVLEISGPLLETSRVRVDFEAAPDLPHLFLKRPLLRQALLNIFSVAVRRARGGRVSIVTRVNQRHVHVAIEAVALSQEAASLPQTAPLPAASAAGDGRPEGLRVAGQLVALCQGDLEVDTAGAGQRAFAAHIALPCVERVTVLFIDDNADVLQLFRRYLSGTRYRFVGTQSPEEALALAERSAPQIIVLDVMMPGHDGWTLLGQLREHPALRDAAILVCSILAQEALALALGAAAFIRKPVSRTALLARLDQHLAPTAEAAPKTSG